MPSKCAHVLCSPIKTDFFFAKILLWLWILKRSTKKTKEPFQVLKSYKTRKKELGSRTPKMSEKERFRTDEEDKQGVLTKQKH